MTIELQGIEPIWRVQCGVPFQVTVCVTAITPGAVRICARLAGGGDGCRLVGARPDGTVRVTVVIVGDEQQCTTMTLTIDCAVSSMEFLEFTAENDAGERDHTSHSIHVDCA